MNLKDIYTELLTVHEALKKQFDDIDLELLRFLNTIQDNKNFNEVLPGITHCHDVLTEKFNMLKKILKIDEE